MRSTQMAPFVLLFSCKVNQGSPSTFHSCRVLHESSGVSHGTRSTRFVRRHSRRRVLGASSLRPHAQRPRVSARFSTRPLFLRPVCRDVPPRKRQAGILRFRGALTPYAPCLRAPSALAPSPSARSPGAHGAQPPASAILSRRKETVAERATLHHQAGKSVI